MKKLALCMTLFLCIINASASDFEEYLSQAMNSAKHEHVYKTIPWLDKAVDHANGSLEPYMVAIKLELMLGLSNGRFTSDIIFLCNSLRLVNKSGGFDIPNQMGGGTSKGKEALVCDIITKESGKAIFEWGVKVMARTNADISGMLRALPYFELANKKGYHSNDLYKARGLIYYVKGDYSNAISDLSMIAHSEKNPFILRLLGISQLKSSNTKTEIRNGLATLKKASSLGDVQSDKIIAKVDDVMAIRSDGLKRVRWADTKINANNYSYAFSCKGIIITVARSANFLSTWGIPGCGLSTTTHTHTIESVAKETCDCAR